MKKFKRFLAMVLSLVMLISCFPVVAEEGNGLEIDAEEGIEVKLIEPEEEPAPEEPAPEEPAPEEPAPEEPAPEEPAPEEPAPEEPTPEEPAPEEPAPEEPAPEEPNPEEPAPEEPTPEEPAPEEPVPEEPVPEEPVMAKVTLRYFCDGEDIAPRNYSQVEVGTSYIIYLKEIEGYKLVQIKHDKEKISEFQGSKWNAFQVFTVNGDTIIDYIFKKIEEEPAPEEPAPEEPAPEEPAPEEPAPEEPAPEEPAPEEPAPEEPAPEEPAPEEPAPEEPAPEEPAPEEPAPEEPAPEEPAPEEPAPEKPAPEEPAPEEPAPEEPAPEEPAPEEPAPEEPAPEEPVPEEPAPEEPAPEEPVPEEPVPEEPVPEEPAPEEPVPEEPVPEEPAPEEPVPEEPVPEEPVPEEPAPEEPAPEEPVYPEKGVKGGVFSFGPKLMMLRGPAPTTYPVILDGELYGNYAVGATVTLTVPSNEHSTFTGWEAATTDGKVLITVNQFIMPATRVDVASQWEDEVHTVGIHFTANLTTGDQVAVSPSRYAEIKYGEPFDVGSFTLPIKKGYIPTLITCSDGRSLTNVTETSTVTFMNLDSVTEDVEYEVIYTPGDADYTVKHYLQQLDGTYSDTPSKSEDFSAKLGNAIKYSTHVTGFEGFTWDGKDNILTVEAEDNVINLYYTRNTYSLNVQNGASGTTVRPYLFGQIVKLSDLGNPTLAGYTFDGWTIVNGDAIEDDFTMPSHTLSIEPIWTPAETSYTVRFWMETAVSADNWTAANSTMAGTGDKTGNVYADDSTAYEVAGTVSGTGTTGDIITKDMINALDVPASITDVGFIFNTMDEDVEIAADGSTIINVYFVRRVYYFHFTGTINTVTRYRLNNAGTRYIQNGTGYDGVSTDGNFVTSSTNSNGYIYYKYGSPIAGKYWVYLDTYSDPANQAHYVYRNNAYRESSYYGDRYTWAVREPEFRQDITEETAPLKGTYGYNETIRVTVRDVSVIISQWVIKEMPDGTYSDPECVRSRIGSTWYNMSILRDNVLPDGYYFVGVSADGMKTWQSIPTDYEEVEYTYGYDDDYKQYYKVNRYRYNLTFVNFGAVAKNISQIMWGAELPEDALDGVTIEPITGYEDFEFAGFTCNGITYTGDTPEEAYQSFLASNSVMTQGDIVLTANWKAPIYDVNFYTTEDATTVYAADSVEKYQYMEAPINPTRVGYTFNGWYYYDDNHNVILYDPAKMPVTCDIDAYASWIADDITADVIVRHFFGESEEDDVIPNLTLGAVYTAEAKVRDGWFPDKTSQSIMVVDGKNEIIFNYTYKEEVEYTVRFVDQDGNLLDIADNPHTDTTDKLSIVLRYRYVPFATPRTTSQTLRLTSGENIATFVYDIEGTREYTINHYTENVDGTFTLYSSSSDEARYYLTVTAEELELDGYEFDEDNSQTSLTILPSGKMEMNLYYKLPEYKVEYKYTSDSELTSVALPETKEYKRTEEVEIEDPLEAEDEWFEFDGWYFDEDCTESAADFEISEDTTLYGKFVRVDYYVEVYWTPVDGEYYSGVREWDCNKLRWLIDDTDAEWVKYPSVECKVINHGKKSVNLNFTGNDQWNKYMVDNAQMPNENKALAGNDAEYTFQWNGEDADWDEAKLQAELSTIDVSNLFKLTITK